MNSNRERLSLLALQWALGLVLFIEGAVFAFSPASAHAFAKTGLPDFVRLGLAWAEMAAAVVFLVPRATKIGGWLLIAVLLCSIALHVLHGWLDVGGLLIYIVGAWAVMSGKRQGAGA